MDVERLLRDYRIPYSTSGQSKNTGAGWVGVRCPFCSDPSDHLGIELETGACHCWRCGGKSLRRVLTALTGLRGSQVDSILTKYGGRRRRASSNRGVAVRTKAHKLPSDTGPLGARHERYLQARRFDPDYLVRVWGVMGTGPASFLDGIDFSHRIVAPIYWGDRRVSFQSRDITGRSKVRYMTCPRDRELVHHKDILYGLEQQWDTDCGICVEGITDVWRLGPLAFATFGSEVTGRQLMVMSRRFRRMVVVFDGNERDALVRAERLVDRLVTVLVDARRIDIPGDPADLSDADAAALIREARRPGPR